MRGLLRIILLVGNAVLFAWLAYIVATDPEPATDPQFLLACGVLTFSALNFVYVLLANRPLNWRVFRLIGLWFDAKISELRNRADRTRQEK
jgi:hypothetical protein